ncbi:hypothetical protein AZF37_00840 [endosymbiont 'TC1' of Trimyema compressum]|uniref:hypothetical protein n=1 Tax=endosymbiont 'TC1' of Trimyema compressum TaxID=243899 RepID=UPI0007F15D8B|nr:hypothetical protein [endosymbiont 'TC1' of Trimyema compressum]AMP19917.1 hypothetical protein AZF37_00840 [endosymbiont 'TC1' of Trimyema compressum]
MYKENKELLILAEDIKDGELEVLNKDEEQNTGNWLESFNILKEVFGDEADNLENAKKNPLDYFNKSKRRQQNLLRRY